jgi:hypothetical protein
MSLTPATQTDERGWQRDAFAFKELQNRNAP